MKIIGKLFAFIHWYNSVFRRSVLKKSLLERKERNSPSCLECGICCLGCVAYNHKEKKCNIWKDTDFRCKTYPQYAWQLKHLKLEGKCRYYWK